MKIITQPTVTLVSAPQFHPHQTYVLPPHARNAENIIAMAGKVCYDSYGVDGRSVPDHIEALVASGHHSVIEHVHVGLFIEGISRGCSHEIVRHRMFNYSQRSTRYANEDDAAIVLDPYYADIYHTSGMDEHASEDRANDVKLPSSVSVAEYNLVAEFIESAHQSLVAYQDQVERLTTINPLGLTGRNLRKWARGKARQLLPHALETRMVMTGNLRAWRHFLLMRSNRQAEQEIRALASAVWDVLSPIAPFAFDLRGESVGGFIELTAEKVPA